MRPGPGAPGLALAAALAACAAPPPAFRTVVAEPLGAAEPPGAAFAREREEQRRGIGVPPALPGQGAVDRLGGTLRATRPAPATGPADPAPAPGGGSLSRLSAVPASPLANPRGGLAPARPW